MTREKYVCGKGKGIRDSGKKYREDNYKRGVA